MRPVTLQNKLPDSATSTETWNRLFLCTRLKARLQPISRNFRDEKFLFRTENQFANLHWSSQYICSWRHLSLHLSVNSHPSTRSPRFTYWNCAGRSIRVTSVRNLLSAFPTSCDSQIFWVSSRSSSTPETYYKIQPLHFWHMLSANMLSWHCLPGTLSLFAPMETLTPQNSIHLLT